jgi:hypothetical protein
MPIFGKKITIMKSTLIKIFLVLLLAAGSQFCFAQCDTTVVLKSSKTNYLDDKGNVLKEREQEQQATITISKKRVVIVPGNDHEMVGDITSRTCEWKTPFKDGKMVLKATFENENGDQQHATITIAGVAGKVTLTYQAEERPEVKIQVVADSFEEKKL